MPEMLAYLATTVVKPEENWRHAERLKNKKQTNLTICHQGKDCQFYSQALGDCKFIHCQEVRHESFGYLDLICQ